MSTYEQIEKLLVTQAIADAEQLLTQARPQVIEIVNKELQTPIDSFVEQCVAERLAAMRPAAEKQARAALLRQLTQNTDGDADADATIEVPTGEPLSAATVHAILSKALDPITAVRGITKHSNGKQWICAFCEKPYDSQRAASMHARKCSKRDAAISGTNGTKKTKKRAATTKKRKTKAKKRQCIKPDCTAPSKGPRFHYLCEDHKNAPERHIHAWQRRYREERDAE